MPNLYAELARLNLTLSPLAFSDQAVIIDTKEDSTKHGLHLNYEEKNRVLQHIKTTISNLQEKDSNLVRNENNPSSIFSPETPTHPTNPYHPSHKEHNIYSLIATNQTPFQSFTEFLCTSTIFPRTPKIQKA